MVYLDTPKRVTYPVPIPCNLDHSYTVGVYTSDAMFRIKVALTQSCDVSYATVRSLGEGGNFTDSKSYFPALLVCKPKHFGTGLVDVLLTDCLCKSAKLRPCTTCIHTKEDPFSMRC